MLALLAILAVLLAVTIWMPGTAGEESWAYATIFSLLPPVIAIGLALVTKEVYTSLLAGIHGGWTAVLRISTWRLDDQHDLFSGRGRYGLQACQMPGNVGILVFPGYAWYSWYLLLNQAGGSAAFGKWASRHIRTRIGAQISVMLLGVLIFVDDYFQLSDRRKRHASGDRPA